MQSSHRGNTCSFLLYIRELTPAHEIETQMYWKPDIIGLLPTEVFSSSVYGHEDLEIEIKYYLKSRKQVLSHGCLQYLSVQKSSHLAAIQVSDTGTDGTLFSANMQAEREVNAEMEVTFPSGSIRQLPAKGGAMRFLSLILSVRKLSHS